MAQDHNLDLFLRRRNLGLTQTDIGRALNVGKSEISKFENGQALLPRGLTRDDYERAMDTLIRERLSGTLA